jgi:hypothetical protein
MAASGYLAGGDDIPVADLVVDCLHRSFPIPFTAARSRKANMGVSLSVDITHAE